MSFSVMDLKQDVVAHLQRNKPSFNQFIKSDKKSENERFFNLVYAYDYVLKKFTSDCYCTERDMDEYIDSIEASINGELCFTKQKHNIKRLETVLEVLNGIRYYLDKNFK